MVEIHAEWSELTVTGRKLLTIPRQNRPFILSFDWRSSVPTGDRQSRLKTVSPD
jgi:hypothetical protein